MKTYWRVGLLVLLYPLYGCFPCPLGGFGYAMRTVQPDGKPIAGASVAVVHIPEGGAAELERRVRNREPLDGWMAVTDKHGKVQLEKNATKGSSEAKRPKSEHFVFSQTSQAYEPELPAAGEASPDQPALDPRDPVGIVVLATGYEPYVGAARLGRKGALPKLTLTTLTGREPSRRRDSATVTLEPIRKIAAGRALETEAEINPETTE